MVDELIPRDDVREATVISKLGPVVDDAVLDTLDEYRKNREILAAKFGGMLPILDGKVEAIQMKQEDDGSAVPGTLIRVTFLCTSFDQIALMAAPSHKMKVVLFEDRRPK